MLKKLIILLLSSILFMAQMACNLRNEHTKEKAVKEFEGIITYHEISKSSDGFVNIDDTVQLFYSHGNYVGIHSEASSAPHLVRDYYLKSQALRLLRFNTSDTLHQLNLNFPIEKLDSFKVKTINEKTLSRKCESIELKTSYPEKDSTTYTDFIFTFSRGYLNIDKDHFKNWNLGFFNKIVNESGAFYLKFKATHFDSTHKKILSSKSYEVISVKEQPIDPKIFEIDTTLIKWAK